MSIRQRQGRRGAPRPGAHLVDVHAGHCILRAATAGHSAAAGGQPVNGAAAGRGSSERCVRGRPTSACELAGWQIQPQWQGSPAIRLVPADQAGRCANKAQQQLGSIHSPVQVLLALLAGTGLPPALGGLVEVDHHLLQARRSRGSWADFRLERWWALRQHETAGPAGIGPIVGLACHASYSADKQNNHWGASKDACPEARGTLDRLDEGSQDAAGHA